MRSFSKYIGILFLTFLFIHCEKDIVVVEDTTDALSVTPDFKVKTVNAKHFPGITKFLETEVYISLFQKDTIAGAIFDMDNIVEVIDGLNNTNYSFRFVYPDTPEHMFYNLVVNVRPDGTFREPYVLKYVCDVEHYETFKNSGFDFTYFTGSINLHRFTDFFQSDDLFSKTTTDCTQFDQYGDPVPCQETVVTAGGTGGGGTDSEEDGTPGGTLPQPDLVSGNGGGNSSECTISMVWSDCGGPNGDTTHSSGVCGAPGNPGSGWVVIVDCQGSLEVNNLFKDSARGDCEDCVTDTSGGVGVNINIMDCYIADSLNIDCQILLDFEQDYKSRMSASEKHIFDTMNRLKQLSYLANAQFATWKAEELFPGSLYNGKGDAFRHAYWNALNVNDLGLTLTEDLTTAHEDKPSSYSYSNKEK